MTFNRSKSALAALAVLACLALAALLPAALPALAEEAAPDNLRDEIDTINQDVLKKKNELVELNKKIDKYREMVLRKQTESASLEDDIAQIENRIAKEQLAIDISREEIKSIELEIQVLDKKIKEQEAQMEREKVLLGGLARKLYRSQFRKSLLEVLLANDTLSDFFNTLHSMTRLQVAVDGSLTKVKELRAALDGERTDREAKRQDSLERKRALEVAKMELEDERALKDMILTETKESELEYRYLLADLKHEQGQADSEIIYLEKALRQKTELADRLGGESAVFSWPLQPTRGLSSRFHDPDYPFRYIFEHPAIDIRAGQGTVVRAAASGIVARAKNAGMGYSYVMLLHNNDMSTVYGHLSKITVKEDTFVERGEILGYSGGMPGTPGAGRMTTGPHLHFETRKGGLPVDPLNYLMAF